MSRLHQHLFRCLAGAFVIAADALLQVAAATVGSPRAASRAAQSLSRLRMTAPISSSAQAASASVMA